MTTEAQETIKELILIKFLELELTQETMEFVQKLVQNYELDQAIWNEFVQKQVDDMVAKIQEILDSRAAQPPAPPARHLKEVQKEIDPVEPVSDSVEEDVSAEVEVKEDVKEVLKEQPKEQPREQHTEEPEQEQPRKKSGFGFKSMLNHLTKSRPKPKRGSNNVIEINKTLDTAGSSHSLEVTEPEKVLEPVEMAKEPSQKEVKPEVAVEEVAEVVVEKETEQQEEEVVVKKYVPTNAMSALASAMRSGLSNNNLAKTNEKEEVPPMTIPRRPTIEKMESRPSSIASDPETPPPSLPRRPLSQVEVEKEEPVVIMRPPTAEKPRPYTVAVESNRAPPLTLPRPRPMSSHEPDSPQSNTLPRPQSPSISATRSLPRPSSANSNDHTNGHSQLRHEPVDASDSETEQPMTKEERARHEIAKQALRQISSPQRHQMLPLGGGQTLSFKRKENSTSGDDKALEKRSVDWMNAHLKAKEIEITDLVKQISDGLYLIYALETVTGQSIGKYNKRVVMEVHKLDNIAIVLQFLGKKGVNTSSITPRGY